MCHNNFSKYLGLRFKLFVLYCVLFNETFLWTNTCSVIQLESKACVCIMCVPVTVIFSCVCVWLYLSVGVGVFTFVHAVFLLHMRVCARTRARAQLYSTLCICVTKTEFLLASCLHSSARITTHLISRSSSSTLPLSFLVFVSLPWMPAPSSKTRMSPSPM